MTSVVSRRVPLVLEGDRIEPGPGNLAVMPGGVADAAEAIGGEPVEIYAGRSPQRQADPVIPVRNAELREAESPLS